MTEDNLTIWPIVAIAGKAPTVPEDLLRGVWRQMVEENRASTVFYDGHVNNESSWVSYMYDRGNISCLVVDTVDKRVAAVAWLNSPGPNFAFAHFCVLGKTNHHAGKRVLQWWSNIRNPATVRYYDIILGLIPESNLKAQEFIEHLGFRKIGTIPKICSMAYHDRIEAGVLWHIDLEEYE